MKLPRLKSVVLLLQTLFIISCSAGKYAASNKVYKRQANIWAKTIKQYPPLTPGQDSLPMDKEWAGTVNFNLRKPNYVIIHHTAQESVQQTLTTFTLTKTQVSAHYVIGKNGAIHHMLNDYMRAWHAGVAKWGNATDINSASIGIELDNNGSEPFTDLQIYSLLKLLGNLKKNYNIPSANFIGHADVAPKRKPDPNENFPWKVLASHGFGLWYDDLLELPPVFDPVLALRIIGYDTSDTTAAKIAFKRHFVQSDISPQLTQLDLNILYNLYKKYL